MLKTITLKKKINNSLLEKKLIENQFCVLIYTTTKVEMNKNQVSFTKLALKNNFLKNIFKKNKFHFPLTFIFFKEYDAAIQFLKTNVKNSIMLKINNKMLKKKIINFVFFSKNYFEKIIFNYLILSY